MSSKKPLPLMSDNFGEKTCSGGSDTCIKLVPHVGAIRSSGSGGTPSGAAGGDLPLLFGVLKQPPLEGRYFAKRSTTPIWI